MTDPVTFPLELVSLSQQINKSTRSIHYQLNQLIVARLPLALPPHTSNSSKYVSGLLHITPIYTTFESLWQAILDTPCLQTDQTLPVGSDLSEVQSKSNLETPSPDHARQDCESKACSKTRSNIHSLLLLLQVPGLRRAVRLRADIQKLTGKTEQQVGEELQAVSKNGKLAQFIAHIQQSVERNPHVLTAYAWVLYMALFSGGRILRAWLKSAGEEGRAFWDRDPSPTRPYIATRHTPDLKTSVAVGASDMSAGVDGRGRSNFPSDSDIPGTNTGLSFFEFAGGEDGEDIRRTFKERFTEIEPLLTPEGKSDIVKEAHDIFSFMIEMVSELDGVMKINNEAITKCERLAHDEDAANDEHLEMSRLLLQSPNLMASRNSVCVTQERLSRNASDISRKRSYLDVIFTGPVAKLISFSQPTPRVSFEEHETKMKEIGFMNRSWIQRHAVVLPILATFALMLAWYIGA
ncbi:hypothetical protein LSUE1_G000547 [Lachnellula suecica]|uniref:Heme oxygenase-like protein n=1 Tax=Lachnellula suecica TaxID=602035 RepID=A0A8T9CNG7_9HELO|nr:hypothetical protein LSUE1_G000547 [Lachnellula suecica]